MASSSARYTIYSVLKEASSTRLFSLLNSIDGIKDLVLDKELISSLDYIANFSQIKACNVEKVFKLEPGAAPGKTSKCVYVIRPAIKNCKIIADHINSAKSCGSNKSFWIIHIPRKICVSELVLEREGVYGYITQMELPLCFFTLDKDLFSLELPDFYDLFYLKGDLKYVHTAATALVQLCKICGPIPKIFGQGRCAEMVVDLMNLIMEETKETAIQSDRISHLVIVDRDIDYVSVLLSQLTYEGMLDEVFGINNSRVVFPKEVTGKDGPLKLVLNSADVIYEEIRNSYFGSVFGYLSNKAKELVKANVQAKSETISMSVTDMKSFVSNDMRNMRQLQASLSLHIGACEVIMKKRKEENFQEHLQVERDIIENRNSKKCIDYIEDVINQQEPYKRALRLMCLLCIAQDGLLSSEYRSLATQFRQSYGCKYLPTLFKLKKIGLFAEHSSPLASGQTTASKIVDKVGVSTASKIAEKVAAVTLSKYSSFKTILRKFNLIPNEEEEPNLKSPKNMSYVFGGAYVPLIGRITEQVLVHGSFKSVEDAMKLLPGKTIMNFLSDKETASVKPVKDFDSKIVLVYVLGGITFAEVAALRLLGQLHGCRILIATTSLINGTSLMNSFAPPTSNE